MMTYPCLHAFVPPIFITNTTILLFEVSDVLLFLLLCRQGPKGQRGENGDASLHARNTADGLQRLRL